jgi:hypothetical protein
VNKVMERNNLLIGYKHGEEISVIERLIGHKHGKEIYLIEIFIADVYGRELFHVCEYTQALD